MFLIPVLKPVSIISGNTGMMGDPYAAVRVLSEVIDNYGIQAFIDTVMDNRKFLGEKRRNQTEKTYNG
jgi:hypothetical protein